MDPITLFILGGIIAVFLAVVAILGVRWARRGASATLLPRLVAAGAILCIVLVAVATLVVVVGAVVSDTITLDVPVIAVLELPGEELHAGSSRVSEGATQDLLATVTVSGAPAAARVWLVAAQLTSGVVTIALLTMIAWFARQTIQPTPFTRQLQQVLLASGLTLAIGFIVTQVLFGIAGSVVRDDLYAIRLTEGADVTTLFSLTGVEIDLLPIGIGLTIIVAAGLVRAGVRLQRDTEGLV